MDDKELTGKTIAACFANARDLLRAAKRLLDQEPQPNIAFHLSVLALEEVGKAALIGMRHFAALQDKELAFFDNRLDDHVFKLFWALWTPGFAKGQVSKDEWESLRNVASGMHESRKSAMYVDLSPDGAEPTIDTVSEERARAIYALAEVRLAMEGTVEWAALDMAPGGDVRWFIEVTEDAEKRGLIFGQKAFDKLAEVGKVSDWIAWLKSEFDQADAEAAAALKRELDRVPPQSDAPGDDKWRIRFRLHSPSLSIRSSALKPWNNHQSFLNLSTVQGKPNALDIQLVLKEAVPIHAAGNLAYWTARRFLAALNIGSAGLWWWQPLRQLDQFYESVVDLKAAKGMKLDFRMQAWPKFEWPRRALKELDLVRIGLCFGMISRLDKVGHDAVIEPYITGIALLGKSDLHLNFGLQAAERFGACLVSALAHFGDWDRQDATVGGSIESAFLKVAPNPGDLDEVVKLITALRTSTAPLTDVTLDRSAALKSLCDIYLIGKFEGMAQALTAGKDAK